jgi:hypothetical protein
MKLIATQTLASAQSNITFNDIPQNFTDLYFLISARSSRSALGDSLLLQFNGSSSGFSGRYLEGNGSSPGTGNQARFGATLTAGTATANTFANGHLYIPNYTSSNNKSYSVDGVHENNATTAFQIIYGGLWSNTAAITSVLFQPDVGPNLVAGTTISLYGIGGAGNGYAPKATGGTVQFINGYWYHTFTSSGTFTPTTTGNFEILVVGGGGGGGREIGGGGGGGAIEGSFSSQSLTPGSYSVTVGPGGGGATSSSSTGGNGGSSSFAGTTTITALGGGGGGSYVTRLGATGGSGGGSGDQETTSAGGAVGSFTNVGGAANLSPRVAGGGGGATTAGSSVNGNGGSGKLISDFDSNLLGFAAFSGMTTFSAGGGGGRGDGSSPAGSGGVGAGNGGLNTSQPGFPAVSYGSGGGGGGSDGAPGANGGNGKSGVVVVRYAN